MRRARGTVQIVKGRAYVRVPIAGERESVPLSGLKASDRVAIDARLDQIVDVVAALSDAGLGDRARHYANRIGAETVARNVDRLVRFAKQEAIDASGLGGGITVRAFGRQWTSGKLAELYPDHVKPKATAREDDRILELYVNPIVGSTAVRQFQLADGERVMARLPRSLSVARRRHVAQAMHRLLAIAVYPAKLLPVHPFPRGFLPKLEGGKAKQWLYPDEDARLLSCVRVPLLYRVFYGVLAREGFRFTEAVGLEWSDLDLERGAVRLDTNKTKDPRVWALDEGVRRALMTWRERTKSAGPFCDIPTNDMQAPRLREHLRLAGVTREALFERSDASMPVRVHDLRATFVTTSLATGKTETWVMDRTGHKSSTMIARYRRAARLHAELRLGTLRPLDEAIAWSESPNTTIAGAQANSSQTGDGVDRAHLDHNDTESRQ